MSGSHASLRTDGHPRPQPRRAHRAPSLETFLNVIRSDGGSVEKVDIWGKRRLAYEITKNAEGIYAVIEVACEPATVAELDRQLGLNESVLRTKVLRREPKRAPAAAAAS